MHAPRPLSISEAQARILARIRRGATEAVGLDAALGRILAADVGASRDLPPFTNSAMDGYAVRSADTAAASTSAPIYLDVIGVQAAGDIGSIGLAPGQAVAITTGAPLPAGADAVVRLEETDGGLEQVAIRVTVSAGAHIRHRGETLRAGATILSAGTLLDPGQIALLAALGDALPVVMRQPRVAVLSTGNELVPPGQSLDAAQTPDANGPMLAALIAQYGGITVPLGIARDTPEEISRALDTAGNADLIITTGGVSVGAYDAVRAVIAERGRLDFWQVAMRPGRPTAFGTIGQTPILALPGNPVAAFVAFHLLVRPAIARMLGVTPETPPTVPVRLAHAIANRGGHETYLRARIAETPTGREAHIAVDQGSGNIVGLASATALVVIPEGIIALDAGEIVQAILLS
ncbi:MAG: molybdopterin molybdotransferase MoeA [Thermomicrobiales bacterium]